MSSFIGMDGLVRTSEQQCCMCDELADWSGQLVTTKEYRDDELASDTQYACEKHLEAALSVPLGHGFRQVAYFEVKPLSWALEVDY